MLNGLSLFSGIGGLDVALSEYVRPLAYCEIEPYCQAVLLSRMASGDLEQAPIWDDIRSLNGNIFEGAVDIIFGGFPCQGISVAGLGKGLEDERSGLFFEIVRLAKEVLPRWIFLENVPAITSRGGIQVLEELNKMGFDARWCVISAASVGALHRRERFFLLAHSKHDGASASENGRSVGERSLPRGQREEKQTKGFGEAQRTSCISENVADSQGERLQSRGIQKRNESCKSISCDISEDVADTDCEGCDQKSVMLPCGHEKEISKSSSVCENDCNSNSESSIETDPRTESEYDRRQARRDDPRQHWPFKSRDDWQKIVSEMDKCSDGISNHVARLRALGNAVVPIQAKEAFKILMGLKT